MSVQRIPGTRGPYDYLLEDNQLPEATLPPDQLRAYLDGINSYLAELDKLDLPPDYLDGIHKVIDGQVSLVVGEKVTSHSGPGPEPHPVTLETHTPGKGDSHHVGGHGGGHTPPHRVGGHTPPVREKTPHEKPPVVGNPPPGMPPELWSYCVAAGEKTGVDPYILAAQMERESQYGRALHGSPSAGDGLMQVEPSTRAAYAARFQAVMGHAYDHSDPADQVAMAAVILADKGGGPRIMLQKYNGGDNWRPGVCDSYGRVIHADEYASSVLARAAAMKGGPV
jgi:hypothetical protein